MSGTLYIVATPIGNLQDMAPRAIDVLKNVDLIAAEDTRHSQFLLQHFGITTSAISYHEHNEAEQTKKLIYDLTQGKSIALISDAGTPLISDPGYKLVETAVRQGIKVTPIPGACALIAALSASGLPTDRFYFGGFLPAKKVAREKQLVEYKKSGYTIIVYESPHRILESLTSILEVFDKDYPIVVARELTKKFETFYYGNAESILTTLNTNPEQQQGEFIILLSPVYQVIDTNISEEAKTILTILRQELPLKTAAKLCAEITQIDKHALYDWGVGQ